MYTSSPNEAERQSDNPLLTLVLDTSGAWSTVGVASGSNVLGVTSVRAKSSGHLHSNADALLKALGIDIGALRKIAVVSGPGSWTGLNIGVSAAKVLGQVLEIPVASLFSLDVLVAGSDVSSDKTCAILDAGRKRLYCRWYTAGKATDEPGVASYIRWKESLKAHPTPPTVIEYGNVWADHLERDLPQWSVLRQERLSTRALAHVAATAPGVVGFACQNLAPHYIQASLFERDLS